MSQSFRAKFDNLGYDLLGLDKIMYCSLDPNQSTENCATGCNIQCKSCSTACDSCSKGCKSGPT